MGHLPNIYQKLVPQGLEIFGKVLGCWTTKLQMDLFPLTIVIKPLCANELVLLQQSEKCSEDRSRTMEHREEMRLASKHF